MRVIFAAALKSSRALPDHSGMEEPLDLETPLAELEERLCGPRTAEDREVLRWRFRQLRGLGLSQVEARLVAESGTDIELVRRLVQQGCAPSLAVRIAL